MSYRTPLEARIGKKTTKAITDFGLIEDGDRVMVGLSGGKDSWALLHILDVLRQRAPIGFSLVAVTVGPSKSSRNRVAWGERTRTTFPEAWRTTSVTLASAIRLASSSVSITLSPKPSISSVAA